jgi:hypothetical protein
VYTARLEVDYVTPLPAETVVVCSARVESLAGRKLWLSAEAWAEAPAAGEAAAVGGGGSGGDGKQEGGGGGQGVDGAGGAAEAVARQVVYARSKSLFVIPRDDPSLQAA